MIVNRANSQVEAMLVSLESPVAKALGEAIDKTTENFEIVTNAKGFEARALDRLPSGIPNRARIKIFSPRPGHTLVFFYKKSLVPFSRDRYSYGGVELREDLVNPSELEEWLAFACSGFHPEKRPTRLRRAFPYEIPD